MGNTRDNQHEGRTAASHVIKFKTKSLLCDANETVKHNVRRHLHTILIVKREDVQMLRCVYTFRSRAYHRHSHCQSLTLYQW